MDRRLSSIALISGILLILASIGAPAQGLTYTADTLSILFDQETLVFKPVPVVVRIAKEVYLSPDDPALVRLLSLTGAEMSCSADLSTLTLKTRGGDVNWDVNNGRGTIRGRDVLFPGATFVRNGVVLVSANGLAQMLGLALVPLDASANRFVLVNSVMDVRFSDVRGVRTLTVVTGGKTSYTVDSEAAGRIQIAFPRTSCSLPQDRVIVAGVTITVMGHGNADYPTRLLFEFPRHWKGTLLPPSSDGCMLTLVPDFPAHGTFDTVALTRAQLEVKDPTTSTWTAEIAGPFAWSWQFDGKDSLTLDLLHCRPTPSAGAPILNTSGAITRVEMSGLESEAYPVTHLTFKLATGTGFKLEHTDTEAIKTLTLTVGPIATFPVTQLEGMDTSSSSASGGGGTVVLDPGHGGGDSGAVSPMTGLQEKDVTLDVCLRLRKELETRGIKVVMTRTEDRDVTFAGSPDKEELSARASVGNQPGVDIFISIHCNASTSSAARGTALHWYKDEDYPLAHALEEGLGQSLGIPMNGTIHSSFHVLRNTRVPAVLIETAYITNPEDGTLLGQSEFRSLLATSIATALSDYLNRTAHAAGLQKSP